MDGPDPSPSGGGRSWSTHLAASLALVVMGFLLGSCASGADTGRQRSSAVPTVEVDRVHAALHDMGARCVAGAGVDAQRKVESDVATLITFARRYPDARFSIDGENGRSLNLLLIAATETRTCAPVAAGRAREALPPEFNGTPTSEPTP